MLDRRHFDFNFIVLGVAAEPSVNPVIGDQFIVDNNATGDFAGVPYGTLARYNGAEWIFTKPPDGSLEVLDIATGEFLRYVNGEWILIAVCTGIGKAKSLTGLQVVDNDTTPYAVGELWNFSNVQITAYYDDNTMVFVDGVFSEEEGSVITEDGEHTITVSYSEGGQTFSQTITRTIVGNDDFLQYVNYDMAGDKIYVNSLNANNIVSDNPADIVIYSTCKHDGTVYEVVIGG